MSKEMNWPDDFINKIICGDCLEAMKKMPAGCIDLIVADPPYKFCIGGGGGFMSREKKKHIKRVMQFSNPSVDVRPQLEVSLRIMKKYNAYWWGNKTLVYTYLDFAIKNKFNYDILTWHKINPIPLYRNHHLNDTEYCILIRQPGSFFNSQLKPIEKYRKFYLTEIGSKIGFKTQGHPSVKPLELIKIQTELSSNPGDIILDPFLGSGTTAKAATDLKRDFIGIEINPDYCKVAAERLAQGVI